MVNFRPVAAVFIVLTIVSAGAAGYLAANPMAVTSTRVVTSTQLGSVTTSTQLSTVTDVVTQTTTLSSTTPDYSIELTYKPGVGFYMTNASGWTLYMFKPDNGTGGSKCSGGCIAAWPAFYSSDLTLPIGFDENDFKPVTRADGIKQLAYYGWPLYFYAKDKAPGDTVGQGVGGVWYVCCDLPATNGTSTSTPTPATAAAVKVTIVGGASANQASPGFSPASITPVRGVNSTVTWANQDSASHTVTFLSVPAGSQSFDSGNLASGATFTVTFTVPGTYTYHCNYHSWMTGTIVVK